MQEYVIANKPLNKAPIKTIAVLRALPGLGDLLCSVPALRALRSAYPSAHITLIGLPAAQSFVERFQQYVDDWLEFPGFPGVPEVPFIASKTIAFLNQVQQSHYDLALQMHGNGSSTNSFVLLLGACEIAGFFQPGHYCPDPDRFMVYPDHLPEIQRNLQLLECLGISGQGEELEFPIRASDWQEFTTIAATYDLSLPYVCIHPGASVATRRWHYQHFACVADVLATQGLQIVLTGSANEVKLTNEVAQAMRFPAINLAGKTSLGTLAALLQQSRLLICNDTGVSHLAAALDVKSVVIFSSSDPQRWAPLNRQRHRIVRVQADSNHRLDWDLDRNNPSPFVSNATTDEVLAEAMDLLNRETIYAS